MTTPLFIFFVVLFVKNKNENEKKPHKHARIFGSFYLKGG